jgi:8-oxo-dGTP diphosphatase
MKKNYTVSAAIIVDDKKILCVQRNKAKYEYISYKYEFPGGKLEEYENEEEALKREISEELNLEINVIEKFLVVNHEYLDFNLTMHSYLCRANTEKLILKEHIDAKWLYKNELIELDWAAADLPIVSKLINTNHELF